MPRALPYLIALPLVLTVLAVLSKPLLGLPGLWIAPAALVLVTVGYFVLGKTGYGFTVSVQANLLGVCAGAALGFFLRTLVWPHPFGAAAGCLYVAKFGLGATFLAWTLSRNVRHEIRLKEEEKAWDAKFEAMTPAQQAAELERLLGEVEANMEAHRRAYKTQTLRLLVAGTILSVVAAVVFLSPRA